MSSIRSQRRVTIDKDRVLHLRKVEGLSVSVIAERFGVTHGVIDNILRKDREAQNANKPT